MCFSLLHISELCLTHFDHSKDKKVAALAVVAADIAAAAARVAAEREAVAAGFKLYWTPPPPSAWPIHTHTQTCIGYEGTQSVPYRKTYRPRTLEFYNGRGRLISRAGIPGIYKKEEMGRRSITAATTYTQFAIYFAGEKEERKKAMYVCYMTVGLDWSLNQPSSSTTSSSCVRALPVKQEAIAS